jgi:oligopeptide/dipeptide ABC transporter ATP-binding protein
MSGTEPLLAVTDLRVEYRSHHRAGLAVSGVSFTIAPGEVVGLVGESGSGKTTIGRAILGLVPVQGGTVLFGGQDITSASRRARRALGSQIQVVFQDPYGSLNPAVTVGASLLEALAPGTPRAAGRARLAELLAGVGLPGSAAAEYPGRFSGGQRQRLAIARALMPRPKLVICDEPVTALDISIQAQVLNLLRSLRDELSLSYLFIGHDLDVVRFMSDQILVLYRGRVVEEGPAHLVAAEPRHPYTQALVASAPTVETSLSGHRPPALARPAPEFMRSDAGCPFADRCPHVTGICRSQMPALTDAASGGRVACHLH